MNHNQIILGDCLEVLKTLDSESVDCVVTSPPYWALRDYGVEGQLGLEPTFQEYIIKLCNIFDEVKRVLKKEGTCWVNIGDTYGGTSEKTEKDKDPKYPKGRNVRGKAPNSKIMQKSLIQIPSRFSIEMTNHGWILRNTIIWHKKNAMPSSVLDRLTNKYEQVFFFVKSKEYFFDIDTIRVPFETDEKRDNGLDRSRDLEYKSKYNTTEGTKTRLMEEQAQKLGIRRNPQQEYERNPKGKNPGDVWTLTSQPFPEAHFATYPEKLIEPIIQAGCSKDGLVLDIFMGAGTTAVVAKKLGRNYLGIELNPAYIEIAERRIAGVTNPLF